MGRKTWKELIFHQNHSPWMISLRSVSLTNNERSDHLSRIMWYKQKKYEQLQLPWALQAIHRIEVIRWLWTIILVRRLERINPNEQQKAEREWIEDQMIDALQQEGYNANQLNDDILCWDPQHTFTLKDCVRISHWYHSLEILWDEKNTIHINYWKKKQGLRRLFSLLWERMYAYSCICDKVIKIVECRKCQHWFIVPIAQRKWRIAIIYIIISVQLQERKMLRDSNCSFYQMVKRRLLAVFIGLV